MRAIKRMTSSAPEQFTFRANWYLFEKRKSQKNLPEGSKVIMRDAVSEEGRILSIFEKRVLLSWKPGVDKVTARISDIVENRKS